MGSLDIKVLCFYSAFNAGFFVIVAGKAHRNIYSLRARHAVAAACTWNSTIAKN